MRPLYFLLKLLIFHSVNLFFKKRKKVNAPKQFNSQTIFVVNHSSAFMDPWVIAELQRPVLFFMTRGDIFKKWLHPITWSAHMIPIFRTKENGADSAEKNQAIFQGVYKLLKRKKSILIFGEGYTDDVFIRSLKPLKKGPARIGFGTMVSTNWELNIKIQCAGINYADPNEFRSEVLISNSEAIHLKDYKTKYLENPSKTINDLSKKIAKLLQTQLTYLEDSNLTPFHNHIQSITKKGIAHQNIDTEINIEDRWRYSQNLATFLNSNYNAEESTWANLKSKLEEYFKSLSNKNIKDNWVKNYAENKNLSLLKSTLLLIIGLPIFILGFIHFFLPYIGVKTFAEKTFKRKVFWSGIKLILGHFILALFSIILCFTLNHFFSITDNWIVWLYIIIPLPFIGVITYNYAGLLKDTVRKVKLSKTELESLGKIRHELEDLIKNQINI